VTPCEAIEAAELAAAETASRNQLAREMYEAGRQDAEAEMAERWRQVTAPVVHGLGHAELDERRWGPGGREHFADPRPGDFPGRGREAGSRTRNGGNRMNEVVLVRPAGPMTRILDPERIADRMNGGTAPRPLAWPFAWPQAEPEAEAG